MSIDQQIKSKIFVSKHIQWYWSSTHRCRNGWRLDSTGVGILSLRPTVLSNVQKAANIPVILGCDANAHHDLWVSSDTNNRAESFVDFIFKYNLDICNVGNKPAFINKIREEVIDLTLFSNSIHARITNWSVLNQHSFSDHSYISFSISLPKFYLRKVKLDPNTRKVNWGKKFQNILPYTVPKFNLSNYSSSRDLDDFAINLQNGLTIALNISAPPKMTPKKEKPD